MAFIGPIIIGCIDYLARKYFYTGVFRPKIKVDVFFFSPKKRRCLPGGGELGITLAFPSPFFSVQP
jgi:hypothetical protein